MLNRLKERGRADAPTPARLRLPGAAQPMVKPRQEKVAGNYGTQISLPPPPLLSSVWNLNVWGFVCSYAIVLPSFLVSNKLCLGPGLGSSVMGREQAKGLTLPCYYSHQGREYSYEAGKERQGLLLGRVAYLKITRIRSLVWLLPAQKRTRRTPFSS